MQHDIPVSSADLCVADSLDHSGGIVALIYKCCLDAIKLSYKHTVAKSAPVSHSPLTSEKQSHLFPLADSSPVSSQNKDVYGHSTEKDATTKDVRNSEVLLTDSLPEDEIVKASCYSNSEKCDTESVGDEIAWPMMEILLPRAVPLLKTFSRKKKKSKNSSNIQRSHENNDMPSTSMNDSTTGNYAFT